MPVLRLTLTSLSVCSSLLQCLDSTIDVESLSDSNLTDLDVSALLNRFSAKVKQVGAGRRR